MGIIQKNKCARCPRKADCALMDALLLQADAWEKENGPKHRALLESADKLLERLREGRTK